MADAQRKAVGYGALGMASTLVVASLVVAAVVLYPPIAQDLALDRSVRNVAVVWQTEGRDEALTQLDFELANVCHHLPLDASSCTLEEVEGGLRTVHCAWDTRVAVPFSDLVIPLAFMSQVQIAEDGELQ